jgi:uncharacterized integral membrane protein
VERRPDEHSERRLWAVLAGFTILAIYVIAFIVKNDDQIEIDFVLFTATVSLIWAMVFVLALGLLGGVVLSLLYRRRRELRGSEPTDGVG